MATTDSGVTAPPEGQGDDLQKLVYGLSHDMGAPLRAVVQFSQLIGRRLDGRLDEKEQYWLALIQENGERAQQMIDALLVFSRLQSQRQPDSSFSLARLIDSVLQKLGRHYDISVVKIGHVELPEVTGCYGHWQLLLENVLKNALQYHPPEAGHQPQVVLQCLQHQETIQVSVEDNGIGVSDTALELLVTPFKRLQSGHDYEGIGMGLTFCERIVRLNDGALLFAHSPQGGLAVTFIMPTVNRQD
ncbi:sensor histidine kinase [Marinobacterium jannaschii]|uniref:sensor histidine kinase n=1 Tax=Marinobacterium jannaschii TaxID=64970 RepID=UPI000487F808|nr:ATP-binding protein [Marinobacterium jannaschii]